MKHSLEQRFLFSLELILILCVATFAQAPQPIASPGTALRELNVIITDNNKNQSLDDINQQDIQVFENDTPQAVEYFSRQALPVRYGLVIDTSGSLRSQFAKIIEAAKGIVNGNQDADETFIVRFVTSDRIEIVQENTNVKSHLLAALATLKVEGGQTALIDAIYLSAKKLLEHTQSNERGPHRNVIVLITDGENRNSYYREDQLFELLRKANLQIFIIGFVHELSDEGMIRIATRDRAVGLIERLAKETGGRAFLPDKKHEDVSDIVAEIVHDLHLQYVIRYRSMIKPKKTNCKIEVKVSNDSGKKKRRALVRQSYPVEHLTPGRLIP